MLKNLRKKLAYWLYPIDLVSLTRQQLKGIEANADYYANLDENEKRELEAQSSQIFKNKAFKQVIDSLIEVQVQYAIREAKSIEEVMFARATINGLELVKEEFALLNSNYEQNTKPKDDFDKFDVIGI